MKRLLQDWVTEQADTRPASTAVVCSDARLTYGELEALSNQVARQLKASGCERGERIALLMPKSTTAIAALLGIYKADAIYVPLDPSSPASRLRKILDSCGCRWLLAADAVTPTLEELFQIEQGRHAPRVGWLERTAPNRAGFEVRFTLDDVAGLPSGPIVRHSQPEDPAHILFTSGCAGTPRGVVITHASLIRLTEWARKHFRLDGSDRLSGHPPLHLNMSFLDIFGAAAAGAELHLMSRELSLLPNNLPEFIRTAALTQWFSVPSVLSYVAQFDLIAPGDFPALKRVMWAGEILPTPSLIYWMKRLPYVRFTNLYGPTETTVVSSHYTVPACPEDPAAPIPIGTACDGEELLVLDESMRPVSPGTPGELYIGGAGLARGYWRAPEQTDAAFVPHPQRQGERLYRTGDQVRVDEHGLLYFLGRRDWQIKSRGHRIELGEIEAALATLPGILDAAVISHGSGAVGGAVICCAYVPDEGAPTTTVLRRALSRLVPSYMLPTRWLTLDRLPLDAQGNVDRRRLQDLFLKKVSGHEYSGRMAGFVAARPSAPESVSDLAASRT
jgi:amino acid adenylation domain-containing protein